MLKILLIPMLLSMTSTPILDLSQSHTSVYQNDVIQDEQNFIELIKNDQVTNLFNKEVATFNVSDTTYKHQQQINLNVNDLIYKKSDAHNITNQLAAAFNTIDYANINDFSTHFFEQIKYFNDSIIITQIQPKLQYAYFARLDETVPNKKASIELAAPAHTFIDKVQNGHFGFIDQPRKVEDTFWLDSNEVEKRYFSSSIYGSGWSPWSPLEKDFSLINKIGSSYSSISLRLKNNNRVVFNLDIPSGIKPASMFIPEEMKIYENGEVEFVIGNNGNENTDLICEAFGGNRYYRAVFKVRGKFINQLDLDSKFNLVNKQWQTPQTQLNDIRYSYVNLSHKNSYQPIHDASAFEANRNDLVNELQALRDSEFYDSAIKQYFLNSSDQTAKQFQTNEDIVNDRYDIRQYGFQVPDYFSAEHRNYVVKDNHLQYIHKYSGISNLVGDMLILDPTSGVKTKFKSNSYVYDEHDYSQIGLKFTFEPKFIKGLVAINKYNNLILQVLNRINKNDENYEKILKPLWEFTYDINDFQGDIDSLINRLKNLKTSTINSEVHDLKISLGDMNSLNKQQLVFYHDLPIVFSQYLKQSRISVSVSQANQLTENVTIFSNLEFHEINFDHNQLNKNLFNLSNNLATMTINNLSVENTLYNFESKTNLDFTRLTRNYELGDSMLINKNFIKYEVNYCHNYQNFKAINNNFNITKDLDKFGYLASDYVNANNLNKPMERSIISAVENNFIGKTDSLSVDANSVQIVQDKTLLKPDFSFKEELNEIKNHYKLDFLANDYSGEFYALMLIKNSNHLNTIGTQQNRVVIDNNMWFVSQDKNNPLNRYYLVKLTAAKKQIDIDQISFSADSANKRIQMFIQNKNDNQKNLINLDIATNAHGEWLPNQEINFSTDKYYELTDINNTDALIKLQTRFENALAELNLILTQPITFNFHAGKIIFNINEVNHEQINIFINKNSNNKSINISYAINKGPEINKYDIEYLITKNQDEIKIDFKLNNTLTNKMYEIYIEPFKNQILDEIKTLINEDEVIKQSNKKIASIDINFLTMDASISWDNLNANQPSSSNYIWPVVGAISVIVFISILLTTSIMIYKKRKR